MKVHEVLEAFWRKEVDTHKVMRAIAAHDDWLVPLVHVPAVLRRSKVDRTVWFGRRFSQPRHQLSIYSEVAIAQAVYDQGGLLGPYAAGISARELFSRIPPEFDRIIVNFGAPEPHGSSWPDLDLALSPCGSMR